MVVCLALLLAPSLYAETYPSRPELRKVVLQGTRNTRELGGLPVQSGVLAPGKLYRSGALCFATVDDARKLLGMGIRTIIDLRMDSEIAKDGRDKAYLTDGVPNLHHWAMAGSRGPGLAAYESYMEECGPIFADFFQVLADPKAYPVLFHCSAGKDRTGILSALLLDLLGTPREIIYDDYLHSMRITPKLKVDREWLDAVFAAVDAEGGTEPFLKARGVTDQQIGQVRQLLMVER